MTYILSCIWIFKEKSYICRKDSLFPVWYIKVYRCHNIILDSTNTFKKINPVIPLNNSSLHTFLLDKNNRIVLIGNPLNGDAMWNLFKSTLENMLAHDGEYVPEN